MSRLVSSLLTLALTISSVRAASPDLSLTEFLDARHWHNTTTSRNVTYGYYLSSPQESSDKPYVLFLHGWPGLSYDWHHQIPFFEEQGYGVIVPDQIGYGRTDKPADLDAYKSSLVAKDLVEILDVVGAGQDTVVVGHDWGSKTTGRLASYFPDRFSGFAFLAISNLPDSFWVPYEELNENYEKVFGYEVFGYWDFLGADNSEEAIAPYLESLLNLAHSKGAPVDTIESFSPLGALEKTIKLNITYDEATSLVTPEERTYYLESFKAPGALAGSLAWYKIAKNGLEAQDNQGIPEANRKVTKPVFFGAALQDFIGVAPIQIHQILESTTNNTIKTYNTAHWVQWEAKEEVNRDLLKWMEGFY